MSYSDPQTIAANLSYVLHEPSTSATVAEFIASMRREQRRLGSVTRWFERLDDAELIERVVIDPRSNHALEAPATEVEILSVSAGAWQLLPRVLRLTGMLPVQIQTNVTLIDGADANRFDVRDFFRGPARLNAPSVEPIQSCQWWFAALTVRPGEKTLLLRVERISGDDDASTDAVWSRALRLAETTIREFVLQWACDRPLWDHPVEDVLPEFKRKGNGPT